MVRSTRQLLILYNLVIIIHFKEHSCKEVTTIKDGWVLVL